MAVFGYIFLDIDRKHRVPIATQQGEIETYVEELGQRLDQLFVEENESAYSRFRERPQASAMLSACSTGDHVVAARVACVFCRPRDGHELVGWLKRRKISLHLAELGGDIVLPSPRRLVISEGIAATTQTMLAALARRQQAGHGPAIREAKARRKMEGRYLGGPVPFGYRVNEEGFLEADPEGQRIIEKMAALRRDRWSYREIARIVAEQEGIRLSHEGVRKILRQAERRAGGAGEAAPDRSNAS